MQFERDQSVGYMINWAARLFGRLADRRLNPLGLAAGQIPVFTALLMNGPASQKTLAQAVAIEQPTMAATLSRMERDGVIERSPDPNDGRSALVSLTPHFADRAEALLRALRTMNADAMADVPEDERETFLATLRTVVSSLERALAKEGG